jgi:hypothetical protein
LKDALETLGFGPCHHMEEVLMNPPQVQHWQAIAAGQEVDLNDVYAGYTSQVDWPGAHIWKQAAKTFPDAKVIHSVRPEESWWNSYSATICKLLSIYETLPMPQHISDMIDATKSMLVTQTFGGDHLDREKCLAAYRERQNEVRDEIEPERLLIFDVAEGWEPLCEFLNVAVPDTPFPKRNNKADFWENLGGEPA